ncbi:GNAT family N-acetyltransferase [Chitinophaga solisilvae]|uniref:GNAT family N-acetyltransferase n=1 Tax=Chitinophaga solisilvae TaxID=1233460 RepID=UPI00136C1DE9|nr:GNAT family N-acetyltransferase [Chitinophaga solisilvae]
MIVCRKAVSGDLDTIVMLMQQLGYAVDSNTLSARLELILQEEKSTVLVAVTAQQQVVGCLQVLISHRLAEGNNGEIVSLVVDETQRGKGIGKILVTAACNWLQEKGYGKIRVRCNQIRTDAHRFYETLGFTEKKTQKVFEKKIM